MAGFLIRIHERQRQVYWGEFDQPVEVGRQRQNEDGPYFEARTDDGIWRVVIARAEEHGVSRRHLLIRPADDSHVELENLSDNLPVQIEDQETLPPKATRSVHLPCKLRIATKGIHLLEADVASISTQTLTHATIPPGRLVRAASRVESIAEGRDLEALFQWLQTAVGVLQSASTSRDFLERASHAVIDLVGLDSCGVIFLEDSDWRATTMQTQPHILGSAGWLPSRQIISQVCRDKKTLWQIPMANTVAEGSLYGVKAVIAAPILDRQGEVIGVLYGDRRLDNLVSRSAEITKMEAMLVELLACCVAAGLVRVEQEEAALRARVQFEQFFTPELSNQLAAQPDLLKGRDTEVTVLFCDIRGFSRISERLGPARTGEWISDLLGMLSDCALRHHGVLVDYHGDEMMTMWGAPEHQPGHAKLACQATLDMLEHLPEMSQRWASSLLEPIAVGIGINTGMARVGNTGSVRKFKYGPLGSTVNLASRVQGATKYWRTNALICASTQAQLGAQLPTRRIGKVRLVNIAEHVELYELFGPREVDWALRKDLYEQALGSFEKMLPAETIATLVRLLMKYPEDGPAQVLLNRARECLSRADTPYDPIWELPGK